MAAVAALPDDVARVALELPLRANYRRSTTLP